MLSRDTNLANAVVEIRTMGSIEELGKANFITKEAQTVG